jgi:hypothetical protein
VTDQGGKIYVADGANVNFGGSPVNNPPPALSARD